MSDLQCTHKEMVQIMDECKRMILDDIEEKVNINHGQKLGEFTLISRESVLKDIEIIRLENGLDNSIGEDDEQSRAAYP